jgi:glycosyltransferase involved in cell wall biosynthesis
MGKAVVSAATGVNGLDLTAGKDFVLVATAGEMAVAIEELLADGEARGRVERKGRQRVDRSYSRDAIAAAQREMYRGLE